MLIDNKLFLTKFELRVLLKICLQQVSKLDFEFWDEIFTLSEMVSAVSSNRYFFNHIRHQQLLFQSIAVAISLGHSHVGDIVILVTYSWWQF